MEFRKYFAGIVTLVVGLLLTVTMAQAQQTEYGEVSVVVPAGGETTIQFDTFCLEVGKAFPSQINDSPSGRAADGVLRVLKTAIDEGLSDSDVLQTQLAIWHEVEGDWSYPEDQVSRDDAQQLLDRAANVTLAPINPTGIALDQAIADGSISVNSDDFTSVEAETPTPDDDPYRGEGTLRITNNTDEELTVYFPFGLVFESVNEDEQDMVAYATEIVQEATPTPMPTVEVVEPTVEPTVEVVEAPEVTMAEPTPVVQEAPDTPTSLPQTGAERSNQANTSLMLSVGGLLLFLLGFFIFLFRNRVNNFR